MPSHQMKPCHTTVALPLTSKPNFNIFVKHCTRVNQLNMSKAGCDLNHHFKKPLDASSVDDDSYAPLQMDELLFAIKIMKSKGAASPGNISPSFLK